MKIESKNFPAIKIYLANTFNDLTALAEIISGVEEESVPYKISIIENNIDSVKLSYQAASDSTVEVGIGVDGWSYLSVHYKKLPLLKPLFTINYSLAQENLRAVCSNAARLVKGTPFIL